MRSHRDARRDPDFDSDELRRFYAELRQIEREKLSPSVRREVQEDVLRALQDPETIADRIRWLANGTYGRGAQIEAQKILGNRRMNRAASLTQMIVGLDQRAPQRMVVAAWKRLTRAEQEALRKAVEGAIAEEGTTARDPRTRRRGEASFRRCGRGLEVQTLILPRERFTPSRARTWARSRGFRVMKIDETSRSLRIRQRNPKDFARDSFRTITLGDTDVRAVVGCPLPGRESDVTRRRTRTARRDCGCPHGGPR